MGFVTKKLAREKSDRLTMGIPLFILIVPCTAFLHTTPSLPVLERQKTASSLARKSFFPMSCVGARTLELTPQLHRNHSKPVATSIPHGSPTIHLV